MGRRAAAGAAVTDDLLSDRFQAALRTRQNIAQAQGLIMQRDGVSAQSAFQTLRVHSTSESPRSVRDRAGDLVAGFAPSVPAPAARRAGLPTPIPAFDRTSVLDDFRRDARLSHGELWMRYFELGGMSSALQVEAFIYGALEPTPHDHDVIALALNDRYDELGEPRPVPYLVPRSGE